MNQGQKLVIARGLFTFIITVLFGLIIVNEKKSTILLPRIKNKMNTYIEENYKNISNEIKTGEITYQDQKFSMKITSKENSNYYFYIEYKDKKITDTYQEDYIEGKTFLNTTKEKLENEIKTLTGINCEIKINNTLNNYTSQVKERIIKEDNLKELKFYSIKIDLEINNWNEKEITKEIIKKLNLLKENNYNPKFYTIVINNKKDITQSIEISNITYDFLTNNYNEQIIKDILGDKQTQLITQSKITYKYLN